MVNYDDILRDGDLRSIGAINDVIITIHTQSEFDELFQVIFHNDRKIAMRAADGVEKITVLHPAYLQKHKAEVLNLLATAKNKEMVWHLAQMTPRLKLNPAEFKQAWDILKELSTDNTNSKIVRVNAIQALYELTQNQKNLSKDLVVLLKKLAQENVPSINARIRKIEKQLN